MTAVAAVHDPFWHDPAPQIQGVLLSDAIRYYIDVVGLIEDWDQASLKPASYGLRLGSRYYKNGEFGNIWEGEKLVIPKNSIVYVSMLERIHVPLYMIGRFNLNIDLIYQGIILGTGPQVDPGFKGRLSCPLHNISNNDVVLTFGDRFATIDFVKTTPFAPNNLPQIAALTTKQLYDQFGDGGVPGAGNHPLVLFPTEKLERKVLDDYLPSGKSFKSSLQDLENRINAVNRYNVGILIAAFALLVTFIVGGATFAWNQFQYFNLLRNSLEQQLVRVGILTENRDRLLEKLRDVESRLGRVESGLRATSPPPPSSQPPQT